MRVPKTWSWQPITRAVICRCARARGLFWGIITKRFIFKTKCARWINFSMRMPMMPRAMPSCAKMGSRTCFMVRRNARWAGSTPDVRLFLRACMRTMRRRSIGSRIRKLFTTADKPHSENFDEKSDCAKNAFSSLSFADVSGFALASRDGAAVRARGVYGRVVHAACRQQSRARARVHARCGVELFGRAKDDSRSEQFVLAAAACRTRGRRDGAVWRFVSRRASSLCVPLADSAAARVLSRAASLRARRLRVGGGLAHRVQWVLYDLLGQPG